MYRAQVDGEYEDWMEVLRLIYHGSAFLCKKERKSRITCAHNVSPAISDGFVGPSPEMRDGVPNLPFRPPVWHAANGWVV